MQLYVYRSLVEKEAEALNIIDRAILRYNPRAVFALFSGGHDSATSTHLISRHPRFTGVCHVNTGIGIPETRQYVREICHSKKWELLEYKAVENVFADGIPDPQSYRDIVLAMGFPSAPMHNIIYQRLKGRQISRLVRDHQHQGKGTIFLGTGVRRSESQRRMITTAKWGEIERRGAQLWVNPIVNWEAGDCNEYMRKYNIPRNPVKELLCISGECLCVAPDTLIATPRGWQKIANLHIDDQIFSLVGNKLVSQRVAIVHKNQPQPMLRLKPFYLLPIDTTSNHPIYTRSYRFRYNPFRTEIGQPSWISAGDIKAAFQLNRKLSPSKQRRFYIGYPFCNEEKPLDLTSDQLKLLGFFMAEGAYNWRVDKYRNGPGGIVFTLSHKSEELAQEISRCIREGLGLAVYRRDWIDKRTNRAFITIRNLSRKSSDFTQEHIQGRYCQEKSFKPHIMTASLEQQHHILEAMWWGDGSNYVINRKERTDEEVSAYSTTSKLLALQVQELLLRSGRIYGIRSTNRKEGCSFYHVSSSSSGYFSYRGFIEDGILWTGIQSVEESGNQLTFNLTINGEPNYLTQAGLVHNCGAFGSPEELEIIEACYPETGAYLRSLELEVKERGFPWGWGEPPPAWWGGSDKQRQIAQKAFSSQGKHGEAQPEFLPLCHTCSIRHLEALQTNLEDVEETMFESSSKELDVGNLDVPTSSSVTNSGEESVNLNDLKNNRFDKTTIKQRLADSKEASINNLASSMEFSFSIACVKGTQAGNTYYTAMVPLKVLASVFQFEDDELPPEQRSQRQLNERRAEQIAGYIMQNQEQYVFSSITANINVDDAIFEPVAGLPNVGFLRFSAGCRIIVLDGQHRQRGIQIALSNIPTLGDEHISVDFHLGTDLSRRQQIFSDLNLYASKPNGSITLLFNHRDADSERTRQVVEQVDVFRILCEKEATTIRKRSIKLFTLNAIHEANQKLLKGVPEDKCLNLAVAFWSVVCKYIPDWQAVMRRQMEPSEVRRERIHCNAIALIAIGMVGNKFISKSDWQQQLTFLQQVDWSRSNPDWEGKCILAGRIQKNERTITALADYLIAQHKQFLKS